jgi:hypothetical protein
MWLVLTCFCLRKFWSCRYVVSGATEVDWILAIKLFLELSTWSNTVSKCGASNHWHAWYFYWSLQWSSECKLKILIVPRYTCTVWALTVSYQTLNGDDIMFQEKRETGEEKTQVLVIFNFILTSAWSDKGPSWKTCRSTLDHVLEC